MEEEVLAMVVGGCGVVASGDHNDWGGLLAISKVAMARGQKEGFLCRISHGICTSSCQWIFAYYPKSGLTYWERARLIETTGLIWMIFSLVLFSQAQELYARKGLRQGWFMCIGPVWLIKYGLYQKASLLCKWGLTYQKRTFTKWKSVLFNIKQLLSQYSFILSILSQW